MGPFQDLNPIQNDSGVFVVTCIKDGVPTIVDIGECKDLRQQLQNHDRRDCWLIKCRNGDMSFFVKYAGYSRHKIDEELRNYYGNGNLCRDNE
ncbi:hypothetical protein QQ008_29805 [Fulvivirgaceae bacterium BMA10]|uniref:Uncharacterized protein n=1 Tax=Splendidivirga corallicola TaxID=3051826 RepID=A0ABT8KXW9_9BACT|nr:hypothetical protein [Fulvivirgaceae bacterium BMA10]